MDNTTEIIEERKIGNDTFLLLVHRKNSATVENALESFLFSVKKLVKREE